VVVILCYARDVCAGHGFAALVWHLVDACDDVVENAWKVRKEEGC
jgi:hypothetical protein